MQHETVPAAPSAFDLTREWHFKLGPARIKGGDLVIADIRYERGGNVLPYFSICGEVYDHAPRREASIMYEGKRYTMHSCGQVREPVLAAFPKLAPFVRWHLASLDGPMHYVENAIYWLELAYGVSRWERRAGDPDPMACFKRTVAFGALPGDEMPMITLADEEAGAISVEEQRAQLGTVVRAWCAARREPMLAAFRADMEACAALGGVL